MEYRSQEDRSYGSRSYGNREPRGEGGYRSNYSASEKSVIQIPGAHIGKIIGPAGRHINDMQRQYNVRIQISKMANDDGTKDAEISGNNITDIQDAIKAINEKVDAPFERRDRGSGGGGFGGAPRDGGFRPRNNYGGGERRSGGGSGGFSRDREERY